MATTDKIKELIEIVGSGLDALEAIGAAAAHIISPENAGRYDLPQVLGVLRAISSIVSSVQRGLDGQDTSLTTQAIEADIRELSDTIATTNKAVADAIDARFPKGDPGA